MNPSIRAVGLLIVLVSLSVAVRAQLTKPNGTNVGTKIIGDDSLVSVVSDNGLVSIIGEDGLVGIIGGDSLVSIVAPVDSHGTYILRGVKTGRTVQLRIKD